MFHPLRFLFNGRRLWLSAVLFLSVFMAVQGQAETSGTTSPGIRARMVDEPVFGGSAYLLEAGKKGNPPLVLVHGLGDLASDTWRPLIPELAKSYHVVTFDLPGFGRSSKQNSLYSPGNYAAFVKWVIDTYVGAPPILVGHSLGGAVALRYAGTYPDSLSRLVLIDVAGILDRRVYTKEMLSMLWAGNSVPFDVDSLLGKIVGGLSSPLLDLDVILENDLLRNQMLGGNPAVIASMALLQENFSRYLYRVRAPTAILWGEHDRVTPRRTGILLEANLPAARLQIIPGAGHVPMADSPRLFATAFLAALRNDVRPAGFPSGNEGRQGRCEGTGGMLFEGAYNSLEIIDCQDVQLTNVTAKSVSLVRSSAIFDKGAIIGNEIGLRAEGSTVIANGLRIEAPVAVSASNSRLDLAGVRLSGSRAAVSTDSWVTLLFSVSRIQSPHGSGTIHGLRELRAGEAL
ncbi:MAG: hypothetical protein A2X84_04075 [Desulfuromonadaceae bacterium GWC2_58_13]|nr:MAG: hypothetical protein A2X84_04075 [Desulfuromonadaceae bacterium GWC2_58_13]